MIVFVALERALRARLHVARQHWLRASAGIVRYDFPRLLGLKRAALDERDRKSETAFRRYLTERRTRLAYFAALLNERNPLTILNRGYSITRDAAGKIIRDAATVAPWRPYFDSPCPGGTRRNGQG